MTNAAALKRSIVLALSICALTAHASPPIQAKESDGPPLLLDTSREHGAYKMDLANALVAITTEYQVPILAELAATENPTLDIQPGMATAKQLLNSLVDKSPQYAWDQSNGVVHFYNKAILREAVNPLNVTISSFQMPENVSELKMFLPARLYSAAHGSQDGSVALSAFPSSELKKQKLTPRLFQNTTGRDILLAAFAAQPHFCSIVILPNSHPSGPKDVDYAHRHWFWFATATQAHPVISVRDN